MTAARTIARQTALATRLLQVLRRQVTRTTPSSDGLHYYDVLEGKPITALEARRLERDGLLRWTPPLDGLSTREVARLTSDGEKQLQALNHLLPDRLDPVQHVLSMRGLLNLRKEQYAADKATAIREQRWSNVAYIDGILTGLLMAEKLFEDELNSLNHVKRKEEAARAA
jgi:hypothetical protein